MDMSFLQRFSGARESCTFDGSGKPKVDVSAVCHEVRCPGGLGPGERLGASFTEADNRDSAEGVMAVGETATLGSLKLDAIVLLRVWVSSELGDRAQKRPLGELRIPLRRLATHYDGALYHTWAVLDNPGLQNSFASFGVLPSGDPAEAFDQALFQGPRHPSLPKVCVSVVRTAELSQSGKVLWTSGVNKQERISKWGPLLRSQQNNAAMCAVQSSQGQNSAAQSDQLAKTMSEIDVLTVKASEQDRELTELRDRLRACRESLGAASSQDREDVSPNALSRLQEVAEPDAEVPDEDDVEFSQEREAAEQLRQELERLQSEMHRIGEEASNKINAANERIRVLRNDRDEAMRRVERQSLENQRLQNQKEAMRVEGDKLVEQKEALVKIVEDLHQTCAGAGLTMAGRLSVESITGAMKKP